MTEQVLVFPAAVLEKEIPGWGGGIISARPDNAEDREAIPTLIGEILNPDNLKYMDRPTAEKDPSFKQVIPYIVVRKGDKVLSYARTKKGGESRLHNRRSVGFGGHINPHDGDNGLAYEKCFWRELHEELGLVRQQDEEMPDPVAILHEPWTEVGSVHFGVVHILEVSDSFVFNADADDSIADIQWMTTEEMKAMEFEGWSKMVIDSLL